MTESMKKARNLRADLRGRVAEQIPRAELLQRFAPGALGQPAQQLLANHLIQIVEANALCDDAQNIVLVCSHGGFGSLNIKLLQRRPQVSV